MRRHSRGVRRECCHKTETSRVAYVGDIRVHQSTSAGRTTELTQMLTNYSCYFILLCVRCTWLPLGMSNVSTIIDNEFLTDYR